MFNLPDKRVKTGNRQVNDVEAEQSARYGGAVTANEVKDLSEGYTIDDAASERTISGTFERKGIGELFEFDPNTVTVDELVRLGLSERQAATITNYRSKGGVFRKREDFLKMYVVSEEFYGRIKDFIVISGRDSMNGSERESERESEYAIGYNSPENGKEPERNFPLLEINRADSLDLLDLPGVGPYYASRIIRYRNRTGGYISKEQLKEVTGIDGERYSMFEERIYADTSLIHKADLNLISVEELSSNPYIGSYLARAIVRFREQSTGIDIKSLLEQRIIDKQRYELLRLYFL